MDEKTNMEHRTKSKESIRRYMAYRPGNEDRHDAHVLISRKGKNLYNSILKVTAYVSGDDAGIIVEGGDSYCCDFLPRYTLEDSRFDVIHGSLLIGTTDVFRNTISVQITRR